MLGECGVVELRSARTLACTQELAPNGSPPSSHEGSYHLASAHYVCVHLHLQQVFPKGLFYSKCWEIAVAKTEKKHPKYPMSPHGACILLGGVLWEMQSRGCVCSGAKWCKDG